MIAQIGNIVMDKFKTLPFVDKYAGVVKVLTYKDQTSKGASIKKSFPADCQTTLAQCESGRYKDLCPDDSKKSVMYLEDNGLTLNKTEGNLLYFTANLDLICWLNMPKLGFNNCSYSGIALVSILAQIPKIPFNSPPYNLVDIGFVTQKSKSQNPFSKYSYDETVTQFLMYPYDYFVLSLKVDFRMDQRCIDVSQIAAPIDCLTK